MTSERMRDGGTMRIDEFQFGTIRIDGRSYDCDVVLQEGKVSKRKKKPSKQYRERFGHTPLSVDEVIPWACKRLIVGTGAYGQLPVMDDVKREAERRRVKLVIVPTAEAIEQINRASERTNAILHVTC